MKVLIGDWIHFGGVALRWSHERAIVLLHEDSGSVLDTRCVDALERVLARSTESCSQLPSSYNPANVPSFALRYRRYGCGSIGPPTTRSIVAAGVSLRPSA